MFIVDDEEVSLFITKRRLVLDGVAADKDIHTFLTATEALQALSASKEDELPAVVLLDLSMPIMDGWQFLDALAPSMQNIRERCRIYILTSSLAASDEEKARENSMLAGFIHKPINNQSLGMLKSIGRDMADKAANSGF